MTSPQANLSVSKSRGLVSLEYVLLAFCLVVIALRATFTEGPPMQSATLAGSLTGNLYSLTVSGVLILAFFLWVMWSFWSGRFSYRLAGMEVGLCLFCAGAVVGGFAAADKRLAIIDITVLLAPLLMALLLVQILDSPSKIKLVLVVIASLGVVLVYQCAEQFFSSNQMTIEQYEQDPRSMLDPLGIEPGTFAQFLFEHRLHSRGVRGFFTTRNSAGSFLLMAFAATVVLLIDRVRNFKADSSRSKHVLVCVLVAAAVLFSLALTRSKGAIGGLLFAAAAFIVYVRFGGFLKAHKRAVLIGCVLLATAGGGAVVRYGLSHDELPGGGSMLVRWQYWHASAKMYADHRLTGVGPGNFASFYPYYKPPEALESVADPHNFPLSILTQYGPLGLVGFLAMMFVPLWKVIFPGSRESYPEIDRIQPTFRTLAITSLIVICTTLLLVRPILMPAESAGAVDVMIYVAITLYVVPVVIFAIGFLLLTLPPHRTQGPANELRDASVAAVLFCAVLGVMLHNLIDFAIFEPGVYTAFWAIVACLIAANCRREQRPVVCLKTNLPAKAAAAVVTLSVIIVFVSFAWWPLCKSTAKMNKANEAISTGRFERAHDLLDGAAADDPLSHIALSMNGRLYLHRFESTLDKDPALLAQAAQCLQAAIGRNSFVFNTFEQLADVYCSLAEASTEQQKADWLNKACDAAWSAIERYPGCGRLHFKLAQIAEKRGSTNIAIQEYGKAIEIEEKYRQQFRLIYPQRKEIVSRLGQEKYDLALERLEELSLEMAF